MQRKKSKVDPTAAQPVDGPAPMAPVLLRLPEVIRVTGLARSSIYKLIAQRMFPAPYRVSGRAVAWRSVEIMRWSEALPSTRC